MNIQVELVDLSSVKKRLKIEIPAETGDSEFERIAENYRRHARLPGFRPGKAPMSLVKRHYAKDIRQDVLQKLIPESYEEAIRQKSLDPLSQPLVEEFSFEPGEPLRYTAEFEIRPSIELPPYTGLTATAAAPTVTDEEVQEELKKLQKRHAKLQPVEDRPAADGDFAVIDLKGFHFDADGNPSEKPDLNDEDVVVEVSGENTHPAFTEALRGLQVAQEKEFDVAYAEDYPEKKLAGRTVRFTIQVTDLKQRVLPDLNDEFARDLGEDETLEQLQTRIKDMLAERNRKQGDAEVRNTLIEQLVQKTSFDVPQILVEEQVDGKIRDFAYNIASRGVDPTRADVDWAKIREEFRPIAEREVRANLILSEIAAVEKLEVSPDEVAAEIQAIADSSRQPVEKVRQYFEQEGRIGGLRSQLLRRKTVEFLVENATIS